MNALDLLLRDFTPRWGGNTKSKAPFRIVLRAPSRAWMLRLDALVLDEAQRAREQLAAALELRRAGDDEAATETAAGLDFASIQREAAAALAERRRFVTDHIADVRGLTVEPEAYAYAEIDPGVGVIGFVMAQGALVLEIEQELRRRGTVTRAEGKN